MPGTRSAKKIAKERNKLTRKLAKLQRKLEKLQRKFEKKRDQLQRRLRAVSAEKPAAKKARRKAAKRRASVRRPIDFSEAPASVPTPVASIYDPVRTAGSAPAA